MLYVRISMIVFLALCITRVAVADRRDARQQPAACALAKKLKREGKKAQAAKALRSCKLALQARSQKRRRAQAREAPGAVQARKAQEQRQTRVNQRVRAAQTLQNRRAKQSTRAAQALQNRRAKQSTRAAHAPQNRRAKQSTRAAQPLQNRRAKQSSRAAQTLQNRRAEQRIRAAQAERNRQTQAAKAQAEKDRRTQAAREQAIRQAAALGNGVANPDGSLRTKTTTRQQTDSYQSRYDPSPQFVEIPIPADAKPPTLISGKPDLHGIQLNMSVEDVINACSHQGARKIMEVRVILGRDGESYRHDVKGVSVVGPTYVQRIECQLSDYSSLLTAFTPPPSEQQVLMVRDKLLIPEDRREFASALKYASPMGKAPVERLERPGTHEYRYKWIFPRDSSTTDCAVGLPFRDYETYHDAWMTPQPCGTTVSAIVNVNYDNQSSKGSVHSFQRSMYNVSDKVKAYDTQNAYYNKHYGTELPEKRSLAFALENVHHLRELGLKKKIKSIDNKLGVAFLKVVANNFSCSAYCPNPCPLKEYPQVGLVPDYHCQQQEHPEHDRCLAQNCNWDANENSQKLLLQRVAAQQELELLQKRKKPE